MTEIFAAAGANKLSHAYRRNGLNDDKDHSDDSSNEHADSSEDEGAKVGPMEDDSISDALSKLKSFQGAVGSLLPPHRIRPMTAKQPRDHRVQDDKSKKQVPRESADRHAS